MKKRSLYVIAFALAAMLCLSCLNVLAEAPAGARDAELDKLFADSGAIRLEEIELNPGELSGPICAIDLSPDGKTVLWRYQDNDGNKGVAVVHEDGTAIPVHFNPSMGIGDPFGKEKTINGIFTKNTFPALEGLSWSPDGRYITFTYPRGIVQLYSADVPVLDTATGDVYFADSYARKASEDGFGIVTASQFSRDGNSIYYLLVYTTEGQTRYQFCRCTLQGDDKQVLYDVPQDDQIPFEIGAYSTLTEAADGSWLLVGRNGELRQHPKTRSIAVIQFIPSEDGWSLKTHSLHIPSSLNYSYVPWSSASGYGLFCINVPDTDSPQTFGLSDKEQVLSYDLPRYVNLVRVLPGTGFPSDVWYMTQTENGVEMLPAEDYLWSLKLIGKSFEEGELEEIQRRISEIIERAGTESINLIDLAPEGYGFISSMGARLMATCVSQSPDGYYALVNAGIRGEYELYLVSLETMQFRPVESPEGIGGMVLSPFPMGFDYSPSIIWNEDGTILIQDDNNPEQTRAFRLSAE